MKEERNMWYLAKVIKRTDRLGPGFVRGQQVYVRRGYNDKWIVYNGGYADRRLTTEEVRVALKAVRKNGKPVPAPNQKRVEGDFQFNLTR